MILAAAGDVDHDELVKLATKHFGKLPADPSGIRRATLLRRNRRTLSARTCVYATMTCLSRILRSRSNHADGRTPDAPSFMVLQSLMGSYDRSATTGAHSSFRLASGLAEVPNAKSATTFNTDIH